MGLTHYGILNSLVNAEFTFIEPNSKFRFFLTKNIKANICSNDKAINKPFDLSIITTPPFAHTQILDNCLVRGDKSIFIEKPFGGFLNNKEIKAKNIHIGYVLRFNPIIQWVKSNIDSSSVVSVEASYLSNTIVNKPRGWRNGNHSGVLNEMGSHIIDLCNYLFDIEKFEVLSSLKKSVVSDVDDIVKAKIVSDNREFHIHLDWVNKNIRKPVFLFKVKTKSSEYRFDQQKIHIKSNGTYNSISVNQLKKAVPYYLRGVDFTSQMMDLINKQEIICDARNAILVNTIMNKIYNR